MFFAETSVNFTDFISMHFYCEIPSISEEQVTRHFSLKTCSFVSKLCNYERMTKLQCFSFSESRREDYKHSRTLPNFYPRLRLKNTVYVVFNAHKLMHINYLSNYLYPH